MNENQTPNEETQDSAKNSDGPEPTPSHASVSRRGGRLWVIALGIGVPCAVWAGLMIAWFTSGDQFTATALLRIKAREETLIANPARQGQVEIHIAAPGDPSPFDIYKATQQALLTSRFVISAALDRLVDAKLPIIQQNQENPERAIAERIQTDFPRNGEILRVRFTSSDPGEAAKLTNAVVEAYMSEAANADQAEKARRLTSLEQIYESKSHELRNKREVLEELVKRLGIPDRDALRLSQETAVHLLGEYQRQIMMITADLYAAQVEYDLARAAVSKSVVDVEVSEEELDLRTASDPMLLQLMQREQLLEITRAVDLRGQQTEELQRELEELDKLYAIRRNELGSVPLVVKS